MSRSFDYQSASVESIAVRLNTVQDQSYHRLVAYYTNKGDPFMVAKLRQARKLSKILSMQAAYTEEYPDA